MTKPPSVLLITSNGWGLGHLIRQLTIASRIERDRPDVRCTILTLSQGAAVAARANLEYAPSYTQPWITRGQWHGGYLRERIIAIADEVGATVVAFDGVVPYAGLLDALQHLDATRVWIRRGVWRKEADSRPLSLSQWFDLVIEPADLGATMDQGPTASRSDAARVGVITDADPGTALDRPAAAAALGVDPDRPTLLVNIGSSALGDLEPIAEVCARFPQWQVLTTKDELGRSKALAGGQVKVLSGIFPLHPYLAAVDLAVTSVGYNAAHEFVGMGVPAIYSPAPNVTDDQAARADAIAQAGAGWQAGDAADLARHLEHVLADPELLQRTRQTALTVRGGWTDGAAAAAHLILSAQPGHREDLAARIKLRAKVWLEAALGNLLRRQRRRHHASYELTIDLTRDLLAGPVPLEHMVATASPGYRQRRAEIADRWLR